MDIFAKDLIPWLNKSVVMSTNVPFMLGAVSTSSCQTGGGGGGGGIASSSSSSS